MTLIWFGLSAIALVGAIVLLSIDRSRRDQFGRVRQIWAKAQGYTYNESDEHLPSRWHRAALAKQEYLGAVDVVHGIRRGENFVLFDLEETTTIVAVQRTVGSDVDIDLRLRSTPPPKDADMNLLGSIGPRVVFATDLEIARRVCDQRMVHFTESVPPHVQMLWSEGEWTLGSLPVTTNGREWDAAIDAVARLSGILHVLPPVLDAAPPPPPSPAPAARELPDWERSPYPAPGPGESSPSNVVPVARTVNHDPGRPYPHEDDVDQDPRG
jgi:hypothetical protein